VATLDRATLDRATVDRARRALSALADLTPSSTKRDDATSVPLDWFRWLDTGVAMLDTRPFVDHGPGGPTVLARFAAANDSSDMPIPTITLDKEFGERLAAIQQLRSGASALRIGWLWVAGTTTSVDANGTPQRRRVFQPLVTRKVRCYKPSAIERWTLAPFGDLEVTSLVTDVATARSFEQVEYGGGAFTRFTDLNDTLLARLPRLGAYARNLAAAAGLPASVLSTTRDLPQTLMDRDGLQIVAGLAVYSMVETGSTPRAAGMRAWDDHLDEPTAFHAIYAGADTSVTAPTTAIEAPFAITPRQREAMAEARTASVTTIAGAPGTGKSHTVTAIVFDALRNDHSVLVTAKSDAAVDALLAFLERQPGIEPVIFGSSERRAALAQRLSDGRLRPAPARDVEAADEALARAIADRENCRARLVAVLRLEAALTADGRESVQRATKLAPRLAAEPFDLAAITGLCDDLDQSRHGWLARVRRRRVAKRLTAATGAPPGTPAEEIRGAALLLAAIADGSPASPTELATTLLEEEANVHRRLTAWLALETRSDRRLNRAGLGTIAALATALRSGRAARRAQLERMRDRTLTQALPVWIGTLGDVDDLLPPVPGLFDLVIVDEAAAIEQTAASTTLLRARRAVVVGDPQQLRHVSFIADDATNRALDHNHVTDAADRAQLDVRRNSLFDAAAAASSVLMLDEHFRSAPHLIDVVASRLYGGRLHVATRTPLTEQQDCVHRVRVDGTRESGGIVRAEIDAVMAELRRLRGITRSIGVVTPFRAQADALEAAILAAFTADELISMNVRVGTAHSFQGNERDQVLCSLALVDGDAGGWAFVKDPHLLAVMLTRARHRMTVISACHPAEDSLLGEYFAKADSPPPTTPRPGQPTAWATQIVGELRRAGVALTERYPVGRHTVDAATAVQHRPVALVCGLHDDGVEAHIDRHLALLRGGWTVLDALRSEWDGRLAELVLQLIGRLAHDVR
jgi:hypothetical protein